MARFTTTPRRRRVAHHAGRSAWAIAWAGAVVAAVSGCSPSNYRTEADDAAGRILEQKQTAATGRTDEFTIETPADTLRRRLLGQQNLPVSGRASLGTDQLKEPEHWPEPGYPKRSADEAPVVAPWSGDEPITLTLMDALQVGARNSREYQSQKEDVFRAALDLDLELDEFRNTYSGLITSILSTDQDGGDSVTGLTTTAELAATRRLKSGAILSGRLGLDLVRLLSDPKGESLGLFADATVVIPLMRGAGEHIVTEPLKQAEREVVYAFWSLETFRRQFAVGVASEYLGVLQLLDRVDNAEANYRNLVASSRRSRRLADAERLPQIQADQALQDELRARDQWIRSRDAYRTGLDRFKLTLGLPTDANVELDPEELDRLSEAAGKRLAEALAARPAEEGTPPADAPIVLAEPTGEFAGPYELDPDRTIRLALEGRLDLREANGRVYDAQRAVVVAADALKMGVTLVGRGGAGESRSLASAGLPDAQLRPENGFYSAELALDLPWERTAERNLYRDAYIRMERATRDVQQLEDTIKLDIRDGLRTLAQARQSYVIQHESVALAERRVASTNAFLQAGRAEVRDLLDAQESLLEAQNARTAALVDYRVAELELQRDMGLLRVDVKGLWHEYEPDNAE